MAALLISSGILILLIIALRAAVGKRISYRARYALWLLVVLRLALPFALPESPASIMNLFSGQARTGQSSAQGNSADDPVGVSTKIPANTSADSPVNILGGAAPSISHNIQNAAAAGVTDDPAGGSGQWLTANFPFPDRAAYILSRIPLSLIWFTGSALMALYLLTVNLLFYRKLRLARVLLTPSPGLRVYHCRGLASPCLFGIWRPSIYIDDAALTDKCRRAYALTHERQHYRHGDHIWCLVRCICLVVYWFHPFVWIAAILSHRDCELACDEGVTARMTDTQRTEYGRCLLDLTPVRRRNMAFVASTSMSGDAKQLKNRLLALTQKNKTALWAAVLTVALLLIFTGCTFTGAQENSIPGESEPDTASGALPDDGESSASDGGENGAPDGGESGASDSGESGVPDGGESSASDGGESGAPDGGESGVPDGGESSAPDDAENSAADGDALWDGGLLAQLESSIQIDDTGNLVFTIPESDHSPEDWNIYIYGTYRMGEGIMSAHYLENEQSEHAWESGKTFTIGEARELWSAYELTMDISLSPLPANPSGTLTATSATIDLLTLVSELWEPYSGENFPAFLRACTLFPDNTHGWGLTKDYYILHTYRGGEQFYFADRLTLTERSAASLPEHSSHPEAGFAKDSVIGTCFLDGENAYFIGTSADSDDLLLVHEHIIARPSEKEDVNDDIQITQYVSHIPVREFYYPYGNAYVSFADTQHGYILYCSDPALGQMAKHLYYTEDGGDSFVFAADISGEITGYPTGITFLDDKNGYIATTYHGENNCLYHTSDGGLTWESLIFQNDADAAYADAFPPVFYDEDHRQGAVILKSVDGGKVRYILYQTDDARSGSGWKPTAVLPYEEIAGYSMKNADSVYIIDGSGILHHLPLTDETR